MRYKVIMQKTAWIRFIPHTLYLILLFRTLYFFQGGLNFFDFSAE